MSNKNIKEVTPDSRPTEMSEIETLRKEMADMRTELAETKAELTQAKSKKPGPPKDAKSRRWQIVSGPVQYQLDAKEIVDVETAKAMYLKETNRDESTHVHPIACHPIDPQ